ncbi:MAG: hypothetical protein ACJ8DJ_05960 [Gemmatimonadales bacterium]
MFERFHRIEGARGGFCRRGLALAARFRRRTVFRAGRD